LVFIRQADKMIILCSFLFPQATPVLSGRLHSINRSQQPFRLGLNGGGRRYNFSLMKIQENWKPARDKIAACFS
jgi:hypothetical protein